MAIISNPIRETDSVVVSISGFPFFILHVRTRTSGLEIAVFPGCRTQLAQAINHLSRQRGGLMMSSSTAKKAESKKSTLQLLLGLTFLLVYATTTQMQADSAEHAAQVVQAHLAVGDAMADQESFAAQAPTFNGAASAKKSQRGEIRPDFSQDESARVAASVQLGDQVDADEIELQSGAFTEKMAASLSNMDENIDAMITDMLSLEHQVSASVADGGKTAGKTTAHSKNRALSEALAALIKQASEQKAAASTAGNYQSFASAEQKVIRLHAQASRLASIRD